MNLMTNGHKGLKKITFKEADNLCRYLYLHLLSSLWLSKLPRDSEQTVFLNSSCYEDKLLTKRHQNTPYTHLFLRKHGKSLFLFFFSTGRFNSEL